MATRRRAAGRARGLGLGAAHRLGHRRPPGTFPLRRPRHRHPAGLPAGHGLRRTLDPPRLALHRRRTGHPDRGSDARPRPRPGPHPADRRRRGPRPGQPRHRRHHGHHRQRLLLRAVRLRHLHEPFLRRPARAHRQAVAPDGTRGDRAGLLDRHGRGHPARRARRPERGRRRWCRGPRCGAGPRRRSGGTRPGLSLRLRTPAPVPIPEGVTPAQLRRLADLDEATAAKLAELD